MRQKLLGKLKKYSLIFFNITLLLYWELINRKFLYKSMSLSSIYPILVTVVSALLIAVIVYFLPKRIKKIGHIAMLLIILIIYIFYFIYYRIFQTPFTLFSLSGAKDALQFRTIAYNTFTNNFLFVLAFVLPLLFLTKINLNYLAINKKNKAFLLLSLFLFTISTFVYISTSARHNKIVHELFYEINEPDLNLQNLGLIQTILLDYNRNILGNGIVLELPETNDNNYNDIDKVTKPKELNVLEFNFADLCNETENQKIINMHNYFEKQLPTDKNEYTGLFEGHNLILITAEALHPSAIKEELTPTLYRMSNEGFVFNNFYNPLWGVSTIDGEYVVLTGLLPKVGVWSLSKSSRNEMVFSLGNQFRTLGYHTLAYHNHTYSYYNRDKSHPNLGYDYYGIGNGLIIPNAWPRSDLEMIKATTQNYVEKEPFHVYYLTVSGHLEYSFTGNNMASKNKKYVEDLPYSEGPKAYIACNIELDLALETLIRNLEEAGIAENTVIAISPDHYPYGLTMDEINEISDYEITNEFEMYKSTFILWKKGMETIEVPKLSSSLDITPTLSNLFGLKYDSRFLMGHDIFSDSSPLVMFRNHSWMTNLGLYDATKEVFISNVNEDVSDSYIAKINQTVKEKFYYSAKILDNNYYSYIKNHLDEKH